MTRLVAALALSLLLLATPAVGAPSAAPSGPRVTGYVLDTGRSALLDRDAGALWEAGVDGVTISADGRDVASPSDGARRLLARAHHDGLRAELLVSNYSDRIGDFDPRAAARLLRHPEHARRVATRLGGLADAQGWDGITVDLESLSSADGPGLVDLVRALQTAMAPGRTVTVDLMASRSVAGYRAGGYRLGALGGAADLLAVMTYDQHGPGWSGPGPVGALGWQRDAVHALLEEVPARQVDLGVAGYGYTWPQRGTGRTLTDRQARALVRRDGADPVWRARPGEWRAVLSDGTVVWWSDARSFALRRTLATRLGVHGLALWRLGSADPLTG
ncbi:MAG: glycosyl hydrolase family 18 protein [Nocardioides sp.]